MGFLRAAAAAAFKAIRNPAVDRVRATLGAISAELPVTQEYTPATSRHAAIHQRKMMEAMTDSTGEANYGIHAMELHDLQVQATHAAGRTMGAAMPIGASRRVLTYVAGSGNTQVDAEAAIQARRQPGDMTLSATSGGWPTNISRVGGGLRADQGTLNAAYLQGIGVSLARRGVAVQNIGFSQGAAAMRDAQEAMSAEQMQERASAPNITDVIWGGASRLRANHVRVRGLLDPVPSARLFTDAMRTHTAGTAMDARWHWITHDGQAYARVEREAELAPPPRGTGRTTP